MKKFESLDELKLAFLDLIERCKELQPQEVSFLITMLVTDMTLCCAPSEGIAYRTLLAGIEEGYKSFLETVGE
jgi:hypothetical protein